MRVEFGIFAECVSVRGLNYYNSKYFAVLVSKSKAGGGMGLWIAYLTRYDTLVIQRCSNNGEMTELTFLGNNDDEECNGEVKRHEECECEE